MNREFIETKSFTKSWNGLGLNEEDLKRLQEYLVEHPDAGEIIIGTGGLRKLRWKLPDKGKSGSIRTIHIDFSTYEKIYLIGYIQKA